MAMIWIVARAPSTATMAIQHWIGTVMVIIPVLRPVVLVGIG